jgi:hypothetical protein
MSEYQSYLRQFLSYLGLRQRTQSKDSEEISHLSTPKPNSKGPQPFRDMDRVANFFLIWCFAAVVICAVYGIHVAGWGGCVAPVLWAFALFAAGAVVGFLFGIPKTLQSAPRRPLATEFEKLSGPSSSSSMGTIPPTSRPDRGPAYAPNTNLEEISDWLTKIIVGFGLIQLKNVPGQLHQLGERVGQSLDVSKPHEYASFGLAIVVFFLAAGFLFSYLMMRLFISGALVRGDRDLDEANRIVTVQTDVVSSQVKAAPPAEPSPPAAPGQLDPALVALAKQYNDVNISDYTLRVQTKDDLAARMGKYVLDHGIPHELLADSDDQALFCALATAVITSPDPSATPHLLKIASKATRLHVRYRIILAFGKLYKNGFLTSSDKSTVIALIRQQRSTADAPLQRLIDQTLTLLQGDQTSQWA